KGQFLRQTKRILAAWRNDDRDHSRSCKENRGCGGSRVAPRSCDRVFLGLLTTLPRHLSKPTTAKIAATPTTGRDTTLQSTRVPAPWSVAASTRAGATP